MADPVRFFFDTLCPWCYQTSRWIRQLQDLGVVESELGSVLLGLANEGPDTPCTAQTAGAMALRTVVALRGAEGEGAVGGFYAAFGAAVHERGEDADDAGVVGAALEAAGFSGALVDKAVADPGTWSAVEREHRALVDRTRSFGVPTIVLDDGDGPAIFGPVISDVPSDEDAVELWRHVSWLTRYENFSELKRDRTIDPDLESYRR